jgi:O-antigen/teichoic acid export membrane protein
VPQLTLIGATLAGLAVPFVGIAVPVIFGDPFARASDPIAILLFALVFGFGANLLAPAIVLHGRTGPVAVANVAAMLVNVIGDIVLVGPAKLHLVGPAIATVAAMATVMIGYVLIARKYMASRAPLPVATVLPFVAGFVPAMTLAQAIAVPVGIVATMGCAAIVILWTKHFDREDIDLVSRLDMPRPLKSLTMRTLHLTQR